MKFLKTLNNALDDLGLILDKIPLILHKIKRLMFGYGCHLLMIMMVWFLFCIRNEIKDVKPMIQTVKNSYDQHSILQEIREHIEYGSNICMQRNSFLLDLINSRYFLGESRKGIMNCEVEATMLSLLNFNQKKIKEMKFLHILVERKISSPLREAHLLDISKTNIQKEEHRERIKIRNEMILTLLRSPLVDYKIYNFYQEKNHTGLDVATKLAEKYSSKLHLINIESLRFNKNIKHGAYYFIKYKDNIIVFTATNDIVGNNCNNERQNNENSGFQFDSNLPDNHITKYSFDIYHKDIFKKTPYYFFIKQKKIKFI